jgi:glycine betaine catabolism B
LKIIYTLTEEKEEKSGEEQPAQTSSPSNAGKAAWNGERGRIDGIMLKRYLSDNDLKNFIFYICGPPVMINAIQNLIQNEIQIPKGQIKVEEFTGY